MVFFTRDNRDTLQDECVCVFFLLGILIVSITRPVYMLSCVYPGGGVGKLERERGISTQAETKTKGARGEEGRGGGRDTNARDDGRIRYSVGMQIKVQV